MEILTCLLDLLASNIYVTPAVIALAAVGFVMRHRKKTSEKERLVKLQTEWDAVGKDVVVLHMFDRAIHAPNPSPFPLKLETWLRMNNIKYVADFKQAQSAKHKSPWITINKKNVSDSQLALEFLKNELRIDANSHLSPREKALARSVRIMLEDHLYFIIIIESFVYENGKHVLTHYPLSVFGGFSPLVTNILLRTVGKSSMNKVVKGQGLGRHEKEEVRSMALKCLESISDILGKGKFLMGDRQCDEDCALFGFSTWMLYCVPEDNYLNKSVKKFDNIVDHQRRIRELYWKDWEQMKYKK